MTKFVVPISVGQHRDTVCIALAKKAGKRKGKSQETGRKSLEIRQEKLEKLHFYIP